MIRKIIHIDEDKCTGCGLCASACHEGAIDIIDGKAKLVRENFCDGFGDCLPACPAGAISFEEREAPAYDEEAVKTAKESKQNTQRGEGHQCPGLTSRNISSDRESCECSQPKKAELKQWPCQIKLIPTSAPYYDGAELLIAADCTAFAYASIHQDFMRDKVTLIGCPKLDSTDYSQKLSEIIKNNDIKGITVLRMEVPCCGGLEFMANKALGQSGKILPLTTLTISIDGNIL